ncbi:MAG: radical SAM protein [Bacteroidia bacterium]|nr:MAG: radical SAM protein [Bacteroidia bacterium]
MDSCTLCAHRCQTDRRTRPGRCGIDQHLYVASVCRHTGEEPVLGGPSGVVNVFFAGCNLRCIYCQNHQISAPRTALTPHRCTVPELLARLEPLLQPEDADGRMDGRCDTLGLVSPTPYIPHLPELIGQLHRDGYRPTIVYNTGGYDSPAALDTLEGLVDIYLPDYKYASPALAHELSHAPGYPDHALSAIGRMASQVGTGLQLDERGIARRGLLVRHLVLPGQAENTRAALFNLWAELGPALPVSLMSQYTPPENLRADRHPELARGITPAEYRQALATLHELGMHQGFTQDFSSQGHYTPDFSEADPFGSTH